MKGINEGHNIYAGLHDVAKESLEQLLQEGKMIKYLPDGVNGSWVASSAKEPLPMIYLKHFVWAR